MKLGDSTPQSGRLRPRRTATVVKPRVPKRWALLGAAFWLGALGFFLALAVLAAGHDFFVGDLGLAHRLQKVDSEVFTRVLDWAAALADLPLLAVVYLLVAVSLWSVRRRGELVFLALTVIGLLPNTLVKELVARPRPSPQLLLVSEEASGSSFPSGHVEGAVVLYGLLFYLALVTIPSRPLRWVAQAACLAIIGLVAVQRMYVGAHWPSDVLGGLLLGGLLLAPLVWLHRHRKGGLT